MIAPKLLGGDLVIENGEWIFAEEDEELAQSIKATMQTRREEFFLEEEHGMRYENLLGKATDTNELRDDIIEAISQEERVRSVLDVSINDDQRTRKRTVLLTIEKEDGSQLEINGGQLGEGGT